MITQIYGIRSYQDAMDMAELGVDHIGLGMQQGKEFAGGLPREEAIQICADLRGKAKSVGIALTNDPDQIMDIAKILHPDILHVCSEKFRADKAFADRLRRECPGVELMQAVQVDGGEAIQTALSYDSFCDYLILDTGLSPDKGIGASGVPHDWNISAEIVCQCKAKVILAGGLGPDNVEEAIRKVRPFGVDSLTKTNKMLPNGTSKKDIDKVRDFCAIAKATAEELGL